MNKLYLGAFAIAAAMAAPLTSFAATYAYVNQQGEVMTTESATANQAIMTAPNIDEHSGVLLLDGSDDMEIVGDDVSGV
jgi:hypothetical protein